MLMLQPPFENSLLCLLRGDSVTLAWAPEPSRGQHSPQDTRWGRGGKETEGGGRVSDGQMDRRTHTQTHTTDTQILRQTHRRTQTDTETHRNTHRRRETHTHRCSPTPRRLTVWLIRRSSSRNSWFSLLS